MTSVCYGFMTKSSFTKNANNVVSEFFELSPIALTYSKHRQEYQQNGYPGDVLHVFFNQHGTEEANSVVDPALLEQIFNISNLAYGYFRDNTGNTSTTVLRNYVNSLLVDQIDSFEVGQVKEANSLEMPDWISWVLTDNERTQVRIWFNNIAFENQYPMSEITVIPYVEDIDLYQNNYGNVVQALEQLTITQFSENVELIKGNTPSTYTRYIEFKFYNRDNPEQFTRIPWAVLIYGKDGDNIDSIKDAIADYIEANTSFPIAAWEIIFPDIFKRTEFMYFPRWDMIAVQNVSDLSSLYLSILKVNENVTFVKTNHPEQDLTTLYVTEKLEVIPFTYKGVAAAVLSGKTNTPANKFVSQLFHDYLPLPTTSPDFNRMSISTRTWVLGMVEGLKAAEQATDFSTIQNPFRRVRRNGKLFVAYLYNSINHLIAAKSNSFYGAD